MHLNEFKLDDTNLDLSAGELGVKFQKMGGGSSTEHFSNDSNRL